MQETKIGWIGLGNMGVPMAGRLLNAGYSVTVTNRNPGKAEGLRAMGAGAATVPMDLVGQADVIFIMVSDDRAVREIFRGEKGLLGADIAETIFVNMSTVSPAVSREIGAECLTRRAAYLDAPVSGSVRQAEDGQLVIMAGGPGVIVDEVRPILAHLGKLVLRVGDTGAGNTAKLAINLLLGVFAQGLSEAVLFSREHGVRPEDFLSVFNNSALGNVFGKIKGDAILNDNYRPAFALKHAVKDLGLARQEGFHTPLAEAAYQTYSAAGSTLGEEDIIAVIKALG